MERKSVQKRKKTFTFAPLLKWGEGDCMELCVLWGEGLQALQPPTNEGISHHPYQRYRRSLPYRRRQWFFHQEKR